MNDEILRREPRWIIREDGEGRWVLVPYHTSAGLQNDAVLRRELRRIAMEANHRWPDIGVPHMDVINAAIAEQENGAALILWTCRVGGLLEAAVDWCSSFGLEFDAVNENLPERISAYGNNCRKVNADEYWDDLAVRMPAPPNDPLTLKELRKMEGEPIYISGMGWKICFGVEGREDEIALKIGKTARVSLGNYGEGWYAYRRKPEEPGHDG